jgi:hypothetical protein
VVHLVAAEALTDWLSEGRVLMSRASAWAVALHEVGGMLVEIEAQYPI